MQLHLRDLNGDLVTAWREQLPDREGLTISHGEIFGARADALVSPANSFGFMDGGIDLVYSRRFGWELSERLQKRIRDEHGGELLVGQALIVPTEDAEIPWLIAAPTMRVPSDVSETVNAYLAFRAVLRAVAAHNASDLPPIDSVLCPGLGTAVGRMPARRCAYQMHAALLSAEGMPFPRALGEAREQDLAMRVR